MHVYVLKYILLILIYFQLKNKTYHCFKPFNNQVFLSKDACNLLKLFLKKLKTTFIYAEITQDKMFPRSN